jgi:U3 small nucleolar RNA-associated protein 22
VLQGLLQEKDYMNTRFFHKRAFYLAVIAKYLSGPKSELSVDTYYDSKRGDPRMTTLILRPNHGTFFQPQIVNNVDSTHSQTFQN